MFPEGFAKVYKMFAWTSKEITLVNKSQHYHHSEIIYIVHGLGRQRQMRIVVRAQTGRSVLI